MKYGFIFLVVTLICKHRLFGGIRWLEAREYIVPGGITILLYLAFCIVKAAVHVREEELSEWQAWKPVILGAEFPAKPTKRGLVGVTVLLVGLCAVGGAWLVAVVSSADDEKPSQIAQQQVPPAVPSPSDLPTPVSKPAAQNARVLRPQLVPTKALFQHRPGEFEIARLAVEIKNTGDASAQRMVMRTIIVDKDSGRPPQIPSKDSRLASTIVPGQTLVLTSKFDSFTDNVSPAIWVVSVEYSEKFRDTWCFTWRGRKNGIFEGDVANCFAEDLALALTSVSKERARLFAPMGQ